jgi:hypothetical protein
MPRPWKSALLQLIGITEQWDAICALLGPEREKQIRDLLELALASTGTELLELVNRLMQVGLASAAGETFRQIGQASRQVPQIERQREAGLKPDPSSARPGPVAPERTGDAAGIKAVHRAATALLESVIASMPLGAPIEPETAPAKPLSEIEEAPEIEAPERAPKKRRRKVGKGAEEIEPSFDPGLQPEIGVELAPEASPLMRPEVPGEVAREVVRKVSLDAEESEDEDISVESREADGQKASVAEGLPKEGEANRFTDLTIYEGPLSGVEDLANETPLPDKQPLLGGNTYTLEVAVRRVRRGISAGVEAPPVANPRQDEEDLALFILAEPQLGGIEITEFFKRVIWPYDRDSQSAFFHLDMSRDCEKSQGIVEVRVYDRALDLLDIVDLTVQIVPAESDPSVTEEQGRSLSWPDKTAGSPRFDPNSPPRALSIDVGFDAATQAYRLLFKFNRSDEARASRTAAGAEVEIPPVAAVSTGDIEDLLEHIRSFWTRLVVTNYESKLTVATPTFRDYLKELRELGMQAWNLLFGRRSTQREGAAETIGELLKEMELKEGTLIQITTKLRDFVFPWSIVYPPPQDEAEPVDPMRFWGARYKIEQVGEKGSKYVYLEDEPVKVVFALDPSFGNSKQQEELLRSYQVAAAGKLSVTSPINDEAGLFLELASSPSAHLVYCYCHGYYHPPGPNIFRPDGINELRERIENLKEGTPEREALETWLRLTGTMSTESWIYVGNSQITEGRLARRRNFFNKRQPIVFLNMCQSAELLPSRSRGLVHVFLDHGASAVVGTESPMTDVFATAFAEQVFNSLFGGDDIGTALWTARRYFLGDNLRNPLGLAYTLYGRAVHGVGAGAILPKA